MRPAQAGRKPHAHSDYVRGPINAAALHGHEGEVDVMIEAKMKARCARCAALCTLHCACCAAHALHTLLSAAARQAPSQRCLPCAPAPSHSTRVLQEQALLAVRGDIEFPASADGDADSD